MWRKLVPYFYTVFVVSLVLFGLAGTEIEPRAIAYESNFKFAPREVMLEVKIEWTQERIKQEINTVFPDVPVMQYVALCEGSRGGLLDPEALNPTNGSYDQGLLQISRKYHYDTYTRLGYDDMYNVEQNLNYGRWLYDKSGLTPWSASYDCWSPYL